MLSHAPLNAFECWSFLRLCRHLIQYQASFEIIQSVQKTLMATGQTEFALHARQIKKLAPEDRSKVADMYSDGQVWSKLWLIDHLESVLPRGRYDFLVLGGWGGILSQLLYWRLPHRVRKMTTVDLDPAMAPIANCLNRPYSANRFDFKAVARDLMEFDFASLDPDTVVINTICEHLPKEMNWIEKMPRDRLLVLQASSAEDFDGHLHAYGSIDELKSLTKWNSVFFEGTLELTDHQRWMLMVSR